MDMLGDRGYSILEEPVDRTLSVSTPVTGALPRPRLVTSPHATGGGRIWVLDGRRGHLSVTCTRVWR